VLNATVPLIGRPAQAFPVIFKTVAAVFALIGTAVAATAQPSAMAATSRKPLPGLLCISKRRHSDD